MLSIYDFKDALINIFQTKNSFPIRPISHLKNKRIGVDCRFLINYMLFSSSCMSINESIKQLKMQMVSQNIEYVVIFNGIDVVDSDHYQKPANIFSNFLEKFYYIKLLIKNFSESSLITAGTFNSVNIYTSCIEDSLAASIFQRSFEDQIVLALQTYDIKYIKSPQTRECQMSHFLKTKQVDYIMTSPMAFIFTDADEIIGNMNFSDDLFQVFSLQMFSEQFSISKEDMRKCIFGSLIYFLASKTIQHTSKLQKSIQESFYNFSESLKSENQKNTKIIEDKIKLLSRIVPEFKIDENLCDILSEVWQLDIREVRFHTNLLFNSPIVTKDFKVILHNGNNFSSIKETMLNLENESYILWFSQLFIDHQLFSLFSRFSRFTYFVAFQKINNIEMNFLYQFYFKEKLEICISYIIQTLKIPPKTSFKLNLFGEHIRNLELKKIRPKFFVLPNKMVSPDDHPSIYNSLFQFAYGCFKKFPLNEVNFSLPMSSETIVSNINLNFLNDLGYINLNEQVVLKLGGRFLKLKNGQMEEELILAIESIRCLIVHKRDFSFVQDKNDKFEEEFNENIAKLISGNTPELLFEGSQSEFTEESSMNIDNSFGLNNNLIHKIYNPENQAEQQKFKIQTLLATPFHVIKNFEIEYFRYSKKQDTKVRVTSILKNAFKDQAFRKILFISRVLFFVPCSNFVREISDVDFYHFKHLFFVIRKSMQNLYQSYVRMFVHELGKDFDIKFVTELHGKLPFQKQKTSHMSSMIKILMQKFLIYQSLEEFNDPFAQIYKQKLEIHKIKAKFNSDFNFIEYLINARKFYKKLTLVVESMVESDFVFDIDRISLYLNESMSLFQAFIQFYIGTV